ncbi:hypothetical protein [Antricoccus suffuscus]|uniref:hypothetical protein n=1 Tax=Antricoccus suffuscus TaxID=1629062 RepID=UPI0011B1F20D|nr:hypothetical protein [Antricoccus suffuscus]
MLETDREDQGTFFVGCSATLEPPCGDAEVLQRAEGAVEGSFADAGGFGCRVVEAGHEHPILAGEGSESNRSGDGRLGRDSACCEDLRPAGDL